MATVLSSSIKHVPILQFYEIGTPASETRITQADFESLIAWVISRGYHPISLSDYAAWLSGTIELANRQSIVITLWGGFLSQYGTAFPFLRSNAVKFNLIVPGSLIENEDSLQTGIYFGLSALDEMLGSGLCEIHSAGYHLKWLFQGAPAATAQIYRASGQNLKWGGVEEFVEDAYSYAPLIGTNAAGQAITTTYTFLCAPRQYLDAQPAPSQVTASHLALDNLVVLGAAYSPTVKIQAKKHTDTLWTVLRNSWQPGWAQAIEAIALDAPFTFANGEQYDLQFITQSASGSQGELVALGSRTAGNPKLPNALWQANTYSPVGARILDSQGDIEEVITAGTTGDTAPAWSNLLGGLTNDYTVIWKDLGTPQTAGVATLCESNSSAAGFATGDQIGGDIYLLESLAKESLSDVTGRVYEDAAKDLALLVKWTGSSQADYAFGYPFNTYSAPGIFLPASLAPLHPVQMFASNLLADRWSLLNPAAYFGPGAGPLAAGATTPVLAIDSTKGLANIENQIDSFSGLLWDVVPTWDSWQTFGWVNEFAADYPTELEKYAATWSYLTSPRIRFNADGITLDADDVAAVQAFLALPETVGRPALARVTNEADSSIAHNIFADSSASMAALETLLTSTLPALGGLAIDIEGAAAGDRSIASAWITSLRATRDSSFPGMLLLAAVPAKTSDTPSDSWTGWCDYAVWLVEPDYSAPLTYGYSDVATSPGPSSPLPWMEDVLSYASGIVSKTKLVVMMSFYGTWWTGGPSWSAPAYGNYYDSLSQARAANATWVWDAANAEWYWADAGGANQGYQPTPQSMKVRLDAFAATGYTNFGVWAIGQSDSLFYKYAEGSTTSMLPYLKVPQGVEQSINFLEGQSSIGALELEVIDGQGFMTSLVSAGKLEGRKVSLRVGYPGMNSTEFVTVATQEVESVQTVTGLTGYKLQCRDLKRSSKRKIFTQGDDGFPIADEHPRNIAANPMDVALTVYQNELGLGQSPSLPEEAWRLYDPSRWDASGTSNPTLISPNPYVDIDRVLFYRNGIFAGYLLAFALTRSVEAKQFLEYEVFHTLGGYEVVLADGRLSPRFFLPPYSFQNLFSFNDRNLTVLPEVERQPLINQVTYRMDFDGNNFQTELLFVEATSLQQFGLAGQHIIESKGARSQRGGASLAQLTATRIFRRYAGINPVTATPVGGAPTLSLTSQYLTLTVEAGDYIFASHPLLPNFKTGRRGVFNRIYEVAGRQPNYAEGSMSYRLLDSGWTASKVLSRIAPQGTPDFTTATNADRARYMFISNSAMGAYSDGTPGKTIF